jgi:hypothetical protein
MIQSSFISLLFKMLLYMLLRENVNCLTMIGLKLNLMLVEMLVMCPIMSRLLLCLMLGGMLSKFTSLGK